MGIIESIITAIVSGAIPPEYMPVVIIALVAWVGLEQWLASTKRIKANSTIQFITDMATKIINKGKPTGAMDNKPTDVPDRS